MIFEGLKPLGFSPDKPKALADAIKKLSDFYIENPEEPTPWHYAWAKAAYLSYFFPLNLSRVASVIEECERVHFFNKISSYLDFGAGLSPFVFLSSLHGIRKGICIEHSVEALHWQEALEKKVGLAARHYRSFNGVVSPGQLGVFSYVLTELAELPSWAYEMDALLIVEPSTREDGRKLLEVRNQLLQKGFYAWAPCLHQDECPLLTQSKRDWCHDRIFIEAPDWFKGVESHLPMKNKTVTFSYLAMKKSQPSADINKNKLRVVGDLLDEKGKYRQLICRGSQREFLSWLKKEHHEAPVSHRGDLIEIPKNFEQKGDELRVKGS